MNVHMCHYINAAMYFPYHDSQGYLKRKTLYLNEDKYSFCKKELSIVVNTKPEFSHSVCA